MRSRSPAVRATRDAAFNNFLLVPMTAVVVFVLAYTSLDRGPVDALSHAYRAAHFEQWLPIKAFWPVLHFFIYTALSFFGYQALKRSVTPTGVFVLVIAIGLVLEIAQAFTGTRAFELVDIVSNLMGATAGTLLTLGLAARFGR